MKAKFYCEKCDWHVVATSNNMQSFARQIFTCFAALEDHDMDEHLDKDKLEKEGNKDVSIHPGKKTYSATDVEKITSFFALLLKIDQRMKGQK